MEENLSRNRKQRKERAKVAEEADSWRSPRRMDAPESGRGYGSAPERGFPRKRGGTGSFSCSPRRGGYGPLSVSPGQRPPSEFMEGFRKFPTPENRQGPEDNWRERMFAPDNHKKKPFLKEELEPNMDPGNQEAPSSTSGTSLLLHGVAIHKRRRERGCRWQCGNEWSV